MKKIIAGTDFSTVAMNAVSYAADMAVAIKAELVLFHVYEVPVIENALPMAVNIDRQLKDAWATLTKIRDQLAAAGNRSLNVRLVVEMGLFYHELDMLCLKQLPYAVVLGNQGLSATERFFFGSHAVHAMKNLMWPLITVPRDSKFASIKRIGLACDLHDVEGTLPEAEIIKLVTDFNAQLLIVNTGKGAVYDPEIIFQSGLLNRRFKDLHPTFHFIAATDSDEGILEFASVNHLDLLMVVPKRHSFLEKLTHRSHTKSFLLHSHIPVMALHA